MMHVICAIEISQVFENDEESVLNKLRGTILEGKGKVVAVGEFGLDYERTQFCSPEVQRRWNLLNQ